MLAPLPGLRGGRHVRDGVFGDDVPRLQKSHRDRCATGESARSAGAPRWGAGWLRRGYPGRRRSSKCEAAEGVERQHDRASRYRSFTAPWRFIATSADRTSSRR
jgi:hypothetical protein